MSKVLTLSTTFPSYHINKGKPTFFVEKVWKSITSKNASIVPYWMNHSEKYPNPNVELSAPWDYEPKYHTIRKSKRWKVGDWFSPRIWGNDINPKSGRRGPYHSKQITIAPDTQVKQVYDFKINNNGSIFIDGRHFGYYGDICKNDGLSPANFRSWFKIKTDDSGTTPLFDGQIICWVGKDIVNYTK